MNRLASASVLALLIANEADAQKPKFLPGYVVNFEGDTLRGFIEYSSINSHFDSCKFKALMASNYEVFRPARVQSYRMEGKNEMVARTIMLQKEQRQVFVEVLVPGKVPLYMYKKYGDKYFLVDMGGSELTMLTNETIKVAHGESFIYRRSNNHRRILKELLSDCEKISSQVDHALIQEGNLTYLFEDYNQCVSPPAATKSEAKGRSITSFGILGGINSSTYTVTEPYIARSQIPYIAPIAFYGPYYATTYEVGGFVEWSYIRSGIGSSFRLDLVYFNPHYVGSGTAQYESYESTINAQQLKIPLTYKHEWVMKGFSSYFLIGLSFTQPLKVTSEIRIVSPSPSYYNDIVPMDILFGYFGGLGVSVPISDKTSMFLEVRYEKATGTTSYVALTGIRF